MGFEPFNIPRRPVSEQRGASTANTLSREEKVRELATLLHSRGLTSSMTDARRLAEGMVDVERKVLTQKPTEQTQANIIGINKPTSSTTNINQKITSSQYNAHWDERFEKFVNRSSSIKEEYTKEGYGRENIPTMPINEITQDTTIQDSNKEGNSKEGKKEQSAGAPNIEQTTPAPTLVAHLPKAIVYGRETSTIVSEVPHTTRSKQIFFEDAPPITQARGYSGPKPQQVEFVAQKLDMLRKPPSALAPSPEIVAQPSRSQAQEDMMSAQPTATSTITVETTPQSVAITKVENTPTQTTVEEVVLVAEPEQKEMMDATTSVIRPPAQQEIAQQTTQAAPVSNEQEAPQENNPSTTPQQGTPSSPKSPAQDIPKIDIFEFFKKK